MSRGPMPFTTPDACPVCGWPESQHRYPCQRQPLVVVRETNDPSWRAMVNAPTDQFILLYCAEDNSRWLAKWQGGEWYGVDDQGLTRSGHTVGDKNYVTGWFVDAWMPIPAPPTLNHAEQANEERGGH